MKKEEISQKKMEGLKLYLNNIAKHEISKRINVSEHTLLKWEKEGNWKELYQETSRRVLDKVQQDVETEKERSLKLIHGAEALIAQKIQNNELQGLSTQGLASLTKAKMEVIMPRPNNYLNLIKNENLNIEINIPEKVKELLNELNRETGTSVPITN